MGWYGVSAILFAFAGSTLGWVDIQGGFYLILNATGAFAIAIDAYAQKNWQPVVLNVVWFGIAVFGFLNTIV